MQKKHVTQEFRENCRRGAFNRSSSVKNRMIAFLHLENPRFYNLTFLEQKYGIKRVALKAMINKYKRLSTLPLNEIGV